MNVAEEDGFARVPTDCARPRPASSSRRANRRSKRERLIIAARATFAKHGFAGAHLANIAATAGIQKSTFFHYFPDKEALYAESVVALFERVASEVERSMAAAGTTLDSRLCACLHVFHRACAEEPGFARLFARALVDEPIELEDPASVLPSVNRLADAVLTLVEDSGYPHADDRTMVARCLLALLAGQARPHIDVLRSDPDDDPERRLSLLRMMVLRILGEDDGNAGRRVAAGSGGSIANVARI